MRAGGHPSCEESEHPFLESMPRGLNVQPGETWSHQLVVHLPQAAEAEAGAGVDPHWPEVAGVDVDPHWPEAAGAVEGAGADPHWLEAAGVVVEAEEAVAVPRQK